MKKNSNQFDLLNFMKNFIKFFLFAFFNKQISHGNFHDNFDGIWKNKSSKETLKSYWNKKIHRDLLQPLIKTINENNIKNILEIGCAAGGVLKIISSNCKNIENIYGTDFNKNFINFGKEMCVKEKIKNINLFNEDIDNDKIFELIKDKKIDLILTHFTLTQLSGAEQKIDKIFKLINKTNPKFLYFAEIFDFNNNIKIFRAIHQNTYPDRIILNYDYFKKNLNNYEFKLLKENYNNCAIKFSQILCKGRV